MCIRDRLVGVGICGLCKLPSYYQAYKKWSLSHLSYNRGDYAQCIDECKLAYPWLKEDGDFLTYYGKALTLNRQHDSAVGILNQATLHYPNVIVYIALGAFAKRRESSICTLFINNLID